ncbi:hypothetical protein J4417_00615 [Candidatus Woesearchaeota archaeon]|nr:hypothetical protein [Candidatus Woesearchaeota archaeon]
MSMYKTSEEGLRKIDQDTFRRMSLKELESWARSNPCNENLLFVVEETNQRLKKMYSSSLEEKAESADENLK